jgi:hypothetical protein
MRHERSRYRLYDRRWRPLTPLLELPVTLTPVTGLRRGFLAEASLSRPNDRGYSFSTWVVLGRDGMPVAATHLGREERWLRRSDDVIVLPSDGHLAAYRPSTRQVFRIGAAGRRLPGSPDSAGMYCDAPERALSSQATYWSTDGGHTWPSLRLAGFLRWKTGPADILGCRARPGRLTLVVGEGDDNRADRVITVDLDGDRAVRSHRLDRRVFGPIFDVLPDGRIIFPAHRPGFMVATDATNTGFEFRPAPTVLGPDFSTVGHEIVVIPWEAHRHELLVSADAGRTWRTVDLKGEGWNART